MIWLVSILAETNRTPFDFSEGESELVSGFNTEYGGYNFVLFSLSEYGSIIFMSYLTSVIFFGNFLFLFLIGYFFIWARGTLPRFRYDKLMNLVWSSYLLLTLLMFMFYYLIIFF